MDNPKRAAWRSGAFLPVRSSSEGWTLVAGASVIASGFDAVARKCSAWQPNMPYLVGSPACATLLPPPFHDELLPLVQASVARAYRRAFWVWAVIALFFVFVGLGSGKAAHAWIALLPAALALQCVLEQRLLGMQRAALEERALFYCWIARSRAVRVSLLAWLSMGLAPGAVQIAMSQLGMDLEQQVIAWGAMTKGISWHEPWRLVVGPLLHLQLGHYASNLAGLLLFGPLVGSLFGLRTSVLTFLVSNVVGVSLELLVCDAGIDAVVGCSSGLFGLVAFSLAAGTLERRLPRGAWFALGSAAGLTTLVAWLFAPNTAHYAHLGGFVAGLMLAPAVRHVRRPLPRQ